MSIKKDIHKMYYEMKDVLIYNQNHLLNHEYKDFKNKKNIMNW